MTPLTAFFDAMLPFLHSELQATEVTARLGASPSGEGRLALYQTLVWRERTSVLRLLYPATRRLANEVDPELWDLFEREHLSRHKSTFWEPNRVGESFPDLVEELCRDAELAALPELADYEWVRFFVAAGWGERVHFRSYDHDVPAFLAALEDIPEGAPLSRPNRVAAVVAVHMIEGYRIAVTRLAALELAAVARRRGLAAPSLDVAESAIRRADEWLTRRGVLPEPSG